MIGQQQVTDRRPVSLATRNRGVLQYGYAPLRLEAYIHRTSGLVVVGYSVTGNLARS